MQNWWRLGGGPEELTRILVSLPGFRIPEDEPDYAPYCPPRPPRPPRPPAAAGGAMPFARKYTTTMPYDSRPCESIAEATPPRAVSPSPCLTSCSALWS